MEIKEDVYVILAALLGVLATFFALSSPLLYTTELFSILLALFYLSDAYYTYTLIDLKEKALSLLRAATIALLHNLYFANILSYVMGIVTVALVFLVVLRMEKNSW